MPAKRGQYGAQGAVPILALAILLSISGGCGRQPYPTESLDNAQATAPRQIVALGRLEPAGGVISISAVPGERIKRFAVGVEEGAIVAAGDELVRMESFDLRQTQLEAAELKLKLSQQQRQQELEAAHAQLQQARAALAQAEAKHQETAGQELQLKNLAEAASIAADDLRQLEKLSQADSELVSESQLRRRRNASDRAAKEYEGAAATFPAALLAATRAVEAARANVELAERNIDLIEKVDQSAAVEMERRLAAETLDQSILRAPKVEGGSEQFTVLRIMLQPGEFVAQIPIMELGDLTRMVCVAEVYEADAKEVFVGQTATIRSRAFAGTHGVNGGGQGGIKGKVTRVGSMVASPGLTNRNPLAPSDRSVVEAVIEIDPGDREATAEAARRIGLQVTVEFAAETPGAVSVTAESVPEMIGD